MRAPVLLLFLCGRYTSARPFSEDKGLRAAQTVTHIPGDGIVPDLTDSVKEVIGALEVDFDWETAEARRTVMMRKKAHPYRSRCSSGSNARLSVSSPDVGEGGESRGLQHGI